MSAGPALLRGNVERVSPERRAALHALFHLVEGVSFNSIRRLPTGELVVHRNPKAVWNWRIAYVTAAVLIQDLRNQTSAEREQTLVQWRAVVDRAADDFRVQHSVLTANRTLQLDWSARVIALAGQHEVLIAWIEGELLSGADRIGYRNIKWRLPGSWVRGTEAEASILADLHAEADEIGRIARKAETVMARRAGPAFPESSADRLANELTDFIDQEQRRRPVPKPARRRTDGKQDPLTTEALEALIRLDSEGGYWELDERSKRPRLECRQSRLPVRTADFLIRNGYVAPASEPVKMFAKAWLLADGKAAVARASIGR